jgi:hypothetical protein
VNVDMLAFTTHRNVCSLRGCSAPDLESRAWWGVTYMLGTALQTADGRKQSGCLKRIGSAHKEAAASCEAVKGAAAHTGRAFVLLLGIATQPGWVRLSGGRMMVSL